MFVKKFSAGTLEEALKDVKKEFGESALILSTHTQRGMFLKKPVVEITAAREKVEQATSIPAPNKWESEKGTFSKRGYSLGLGNRHPNRLRREDLQDAAHDSNRTRRYVDIAPEPLPPVEIRKNVSIRLENSFIRAGFTQESARELANRLVMEFSKQELGHPATLEKIKTKILAGQIQVVSSDSVSSQKNFIAMGPPGSGKTSFLVKLSVFLRNKGIKTALASRERRKVTGPGEMAHYAKILRVPFAHDLRAKSREGCTLIDSSAICVQNGKTHRDLDQLLLSVDRPFAFLVLDATQRLEELMRSAEWASRHHPVAVAFSKVDLVSNLGTIYEFLKKSQLPLFSMSVSDSFRAGLRFLGTLELASAVLSGGFRNE